MQLPRAYERAVGMTALGSFMDVHPHEDPQRVYGLASMALVSSAINARDEFRLPIVGIDIAGEERGYPAGGRACPVLCLHRRAPTRAHSVQTRTPRLTWCDTARACTHRFPYSG